MFGSTISHKVNALQVAVFNALIIRARGRGYNLCQGVGDRGQGGGCPPTFQVEGQCPSTFAQLTPIFLNKNTAWVSQNALQST